MFEDDHRGCGAREEGVEGEGEKGGGNGEIMSTEERGMKRS